MSADLAQAERAALCDLLLEVGPDAPTLCAGWTTTDLAAHLMVRDRRPDVGPGLILSGPFARHTARVTRRAAERVPFEHLVTRIRSGPPWPIRLVDGPVNLVEYFVHLEDVRRAVDGWAPRSGLDDLQDALWPFQKSGTKLRTRRVQDVGLSIARPGGQPVAVRSGSRQVTATGDPGELALFFFGRRDRSRVDLTGDPDGVSEVRTAPIGF
ncbi:MAG: TIGR03085 family metal-binding protein [Acidimicrobiales bacterium]|jgi:uncharacterized protein (TIGR03085 family)|nr:TIGR03085 family metal-binding protein [Acidimicrobiales bacterium]|tara:strand:- start:368 stop:1000 length:633 start_codon:yes stop_codon:yes gene_type:complete